GQRLRRRRRSATDQSSDREHGVERIAERSEEVALQRCREQVESLAETTGQLRRIGWHPLTELAQVANEAAQRLDLRERQAVERGDHLSEFGGRIGCQLSKHVTGAAQA